MTNLEALETIKCLNFCGICTTGDCINCVRKQAKDKAIEALENQDMVWVPCSERLPKVRGYYMCSTSEDPDDVTPYWFERTENKWYVVDTEISYDGTVIAWQPTSKSYKG